MPTTIHISRLIHSGTPSKPGCIGTEDPAIWAHILHLAGHTYTATLKSDVINSVPTFDMLCAHFIAYPQMWFRTATPISLPAVAI